MSDRFLRRCWFTLVIAVFACLPAAVPATAVEITGAAWNGTDFVVALSDSAAYAVDLVESDSAEIVIRISGATRGAGVPNAAIGGPNDRRAAITPIDGGIRLTITRPGRIGYSTLWRPYSHRLVIHTFDWDSLSYQEEQYHKGLLALEEGLPDRAAELLGVAHATGDRRAGSVLGVHYARAGRDSLAIHYLSSPVDGDDYAALADAYRHTGDTTAARTSEANARRLLAGDLAAEGAVPAPDTSRFDGETPNAGTMLNSKKPGDWRYIALGTMAILILLGLIIWAAGRSLMRRGAQPAQPQGAQRPATPAPPAASEAPRTEPASHPSAAASPAVEAPAPAVAAPAPPASAAQTPAAAAPAPVAAGYAASSAIPVSHTAPAAPPAPEPPTAPQPVVRPVEESRPEARSDAAEPAHEPARPELRTERTEDPPHELERPIPTQAAEVRQKIQSQRKDMPAPAESTVAAARRLNVSRDNVELRKKMADAAARRDQGGR